MPRKKEPPPAKSPYTHGEVVMALCHLLSRAIKALRGNKPVGNRPLADEIEAMVYEIVIDFEGDPGDEEREAEHRRKAKEAREWREANARRNQHGRQ